MEQELWEQGPGTLRTGSMIQEVKKLRSNMEQAPYVKALNVSESVWVIDGERDRGEGR